MSLARNGREALDLLDSDATVDLVLSDMRMPEVRRTRHARGQHLS